MINIEETKRMREENTFLTGCILDMNLFFINLKKNLKEKYEEITADEIIININNFQEKWMPVIDKVKSRQGIGNDGM